MKARKRDLQYHIGELREVSWQIQAIAELIRTQSSDNTVPLNADELSWGLGEVLGRLGRRVVITSRRLEEMDLAQFKSNNNSKKK